MIRAGIAGLGRWGRVLTDSIQGKSDQIRITAGCTGRKDRAVDYCRDQGIELRNSLDELLSDPDIDAVLLATPHSQHRDQIIQAAEAGKHIFVEKPFTLTKADAIAALAACEKANVVCAIGHNRRFLPSMRQLRDLTRAGTFGNILHVEGAFHAAGGLNYSQAHWRANGSESPAGGMTGLGIHSLDALISCLGPIAEVTATSERRATAVPVDDVTFVIFRFAGGFTGYYSTIFATVRDWRIQIIGDKGWAEMRDHERLTIKLMDEEDQNLTFEKTDIERAELEAFASAASGGPAYPIPWTDVIHATAVLEAIIISASTQKPVRL